MTAQPLHLVKTLPQSAAIYTRISSDALRKGDGVDRQEAAIRQMLEAAGWGVGEVYIDNDLSASPFARHERPEYQRMMADVEAGIRDGIAATKMERITREVIEGAKFIPWVRAQGVPLMTCEGCDTETSSGRMMITFRLGMAQEEAERISERVRDQKEQERNRGLFVTSQRSYGYEVDGEKVGLKGNRACHYGVHNDAEVAVIHRMRDMALEGYTATGIAKLLNDDGLTTVGGQRWTNVYVKRILTSPLYAGYVAYDGQIVRESVNIKPVFTPDEHEELVSLFAGRVQLNHVSARRHVLAGFVYCGSCGKKMTAQTGNRNWRWSCPKNRGGCGRSRNYELVGTKVDKLIGKLIAKDSPEVETANEDAEAATRKAIAELEGEITELKERFRAGEIHRTDFYDLLTGFRADADKMEAELKVTKREHRAAPDRFTAVALWQDESPEAIGPRRKLLARYISRVIIKPVGRVGPNKTALTESIEILEVA